MKITKKQLKRIIQEEIGRVMSEEGDPHEGGDKPEIGEPSRGASLEALWRDLKVLLENWTDREHQYYKDLYNLMEDYSTSPDRPTRLPGQEEPSDENLEEAIRKEIALALR